MGRLHDPLHLMPPYNLNLKLLYGKVIQLALDWDQKIPQNLQLEMFEILKPFLEMDKILFPRRVQVFT